MTSLQLPKPAPPGLDPPAPPSYADDLLSVAFGAWLVIGLFLDGWAHNHQRPETIFTPWHAVFYSGFLACALHTLSILRRHGVTLDNWRRRMPPGQGLTVAGLAVFLVGGAGDLVWHSVFG